MQNRRDGFVASATTVLRLAREAEEVQMRKVGSQPAPARLHVSLVSGMVANAGANPGNRML